MNKTYFYTSLIIGFVLFVSTPSFAFMSDAFIGDTPNRLEVGSTSLKGGEYFAYERTLTDESSISIFNKAQPREAEILLLNYHPDYTDLTAISYNKQLFGYRPNNIPVPVIALAVSGGLISGTYVDTSGPVNKYFNKTSLEFGAEASLRGLFPLLIVVMFPTKMSLGMYYSDSGTYSKYMLSFSIFRGIEFLVSVWTSTTLTGDFSSGFQVNDFDHYVLSGIVIHF